MRTPETSITHVLGDTSGDHDFKRRQLYAGGVMDLDHQWTAGAATLVEVGDDIADRGFGGRANVALAQSLRKQAVAQGGRVLRLAGNHEFDAITSLSSLATLERHFGKYCVPFFRGFYEFLEMAGLVPSRPLEDGCKSPINIPEDDSLGRVLNEFIECFYSGEVLQRMWEAEEGAAFLTELRSLQVVHDSGNGLWVMHMDSTHAQVTSIFEHGGPDTINQRFRELVHRALDPDLPTEARMSAAREFYKMNEPGAPLHDVHRYYGARCNRLRRGLVRRLKRAGVHTLISGHSKNIAPQGYLETDGILQVGVENYGGESARSLGRWTPDRVNLARVEVQSGTRTVFHSRSQPSVIVNPQWTQVDFSPFSQAQPSSS